MKYSLIFAATAAAYDVYGGHGEKDVKSTPVYKASTSSKPAGYTTIYPGYGKEPVTVTKQHQSYPTCVSAAYDGKSCNEWKDDTYVSTTIKDYNGNYKVITKTDEPVTVYQTKKTITHDATGYYPTQTGGYAHPTGSANYKDGKWTELYEKIEEVPYKKMGPHALPGYPGSGLYPEGDKKQPVKVKEYKDGKWSEYDHEYKYGVPKDEVKTYEKPGVYTVPSKDVYVDKPYTHPAEATKTAKAGETCTYGGAYVDAKETGYVTGAYGAYETKYVDGKTMTETVVKYTTVYVTKTGKVEISKPTTTVYDHDTKVVYPTAKSYDAGYYHQDAKVITITKSGEAYTCKYEQKTKYPMTATSTGKKDGEFSAYPTKTPVHDSKYPMPTPSKSVYDDKDYDNKHNNGKDGKDGKDYDNKDGGHKHEDGKDHDNKDGDNKHNDGKDGKDYENKHGDDKHNDGKDHDDKYPHGKPSSTYPSQATSTPCESDKQKPTPTPYKPVDDKHYDGKYPEQHAKSTPVHDGKYPEPTPSKPVYDGKNYDAKYPASTPAYDAKYPAATPVYDGKHPEATPSKPVYDGKYPEEPAKSTPAYDAGKHPEATPAYNGDKNAYGAGYKRSRIARAM